MLIPNLTFVIFTYNEQARIGRVIENFKSIAPILVVDNYSDDNTLDIARKAGCQVLMNKNKGWVEDEETTLKVQAAVQTEWIYWGFSDEMLSKDCMHVLYDRIRSGQFDVISMTRKNYYYGTFCRNAFADRMNRVFKKNAIDFRGNRIHGFGKVAVPAERVCLLEDRYFVHHFISNTAKTYVATMDRYTDIEAGETGHRGGVLPALVAPVRMFFTHFVIRQGYKGGLPVFYLILQMVIYRWLGVMKQYETKRQLNRVAIEALNDKARDCLLNEMQSPTR